MRPSGPASGYRSSALDSFEARITEGDRVGEAADAVTALLNNPSVGGVSNVAVKPEQPAEPTIDSTARLFSPTVRQTPVTLTFDARYEQWGDFFRACARCRRRSISRESKIAPGASRPAGLMRAKVSLLAFHRPGVVARREEVQEKPGAGREARTRLMREPDPVVTGILVSGGRRSALIDGRLVRTGDRLPAGVVQDIEPDAVVIVAPDGQIRRLQIARPGIGTQPR